MTTSNTIASSGVGGQGGAANGVGGQTSAPCLDISVETEGHSPSNFGGGGPEGPCHVQLTGLLDAVDVSTLYVSLNFFNAPDVVLHRVDSLSSCLGDDAAYYLDGETFRLCPATCARTASAILDSITITADCFE